MHCGPQEVDADIYVNDKDKLDLGELRLSFIHTPGHTKGCMCIRVNNEMFTGDTLFAGSIGRTDLYGGNETEMMQSLMKFMDMPHDLIVLPGHGPRSTIKQELTTNMYLQYVKKMVDV